MPSRLSLSLSLSLVHSQESVAKATDVAKKTASTAIANASKANLTRIQKRAALTRKLSADHFQKITDKSLLPWAELRQQWPAYEAQLVQLRSQRKAIESEENEQVRNTASKALIAALQPLGPFLQSAKYRDIDSKLTEEQVAEIKRLEDADRVPAELGENNAEIKVLTPLDSYGLMYFSVPIELQGPPDELVYITSNGSGRFDNDLDQIELRFNEQGLASSSWVSMGNATGTTVLQVTSPAAINEVLINVEIVELQLLPLPKITTPGK